MNASLTVGQELPHGDRQVEAAGILFIRRSEVAKRRGASVHYMLYKLTLLTRSYPE